MVLELVQQVQLAALLSEDRSRTFFGRDFHRLQRCCTHYRGVGAAEEVGRKKALSVGARLRAAWRRCAVAWRRRQTGHAARARAHPALDAEPRLSLLWRFRLAMRKAASR